MSDPSKRAVSLESAIAMDDLRNRCVDYIAEHEPELDPFQGGYFEDETPGGLRIQIGPGWMHMIGQFETPYGDVEVEVSHWYGDPNSPHVTREFANGIRQSVCKKDHAQVAKDLLGLLDPEVTSV